jgi:uncharacterized protein (DUF2267 family)
MDYEPFITTVEVEGRVGWEDAERATQVTLQTLAERISPGERRDLATQLPPQAAAWLVDPDVVPEGFDVDEFLRRIAEREQVDVDTAERHAHAVFTALGRAVSDEEIDDLKSELPRDFEPLLAEAEGRKVEIISTRQFLRSVAEHGAADMDGARRATIAVLSVLAERIATAQVDDLIARLPAELHPPLERGKVRSGATAQPMSAAAFAERVAKLEGVAVGQAVDHVHAVLVTVRDAVGEDEFRDIDDELPADFDPLLGRHGAQRRS